ncbi:unnamed protein product [Ambrosiozyma monospora]|uniref:Unnamed protein product n=1 Tax=Ambrosiozyma monospora TaxID=43982 RepID=A0ACB5SVH5_AMBMO|nr:unnamed protein product [Ambrosiozyma monospora]
MKPRSESNASEHKENVNRVIMNLIDSCHVKRNCPDIGGVRVGVARLKFDLNHDICLYLKSCVDGQWRLVVHTKKDLIKVLKLLKIENPNIFFSTSDLWFPSFYEVGETPSIDYSNKMKVNKQLIGLELLITGLLLDDGLNDNPILMSFFTTQRPLNEMQQLKMVVSSRELYEETLLAKKGQLLQPDDDEKVLLISPEEVGNYKTFLKYSMNEITGSFQLLERFYKILVFNVIKEKDLRYVLENILFLTAGTLDPSKAPKNLNQINFEGLEALSKLHETLASLEIPEIKERLIESVKLLRNTTNELLTSINNILDKKIKKWWSLYFDIKKTKDELIKVLKIETTYHGEVNNEMSATIQAAILEIGKLIGELDLDSMVVNHLSRDNSINAMNASDVSDLASNSGSSGIASSGASYFIGIIERRRHSYVDTLIDDYTKLRDEFVDLNLNIKINYESLCVEISNFYLFKKKFVRFMMSRYITDSLHVLKLQCGVMVNQLQKLKEAQGH